MATRAFNLTALREGLAPFRLYWFPRLRSTNDHAAALRNRGDLFAPAVVLTSRQTKGRGRGDHAWWSADGSLTVTFAFPLDEQIAPHQLPLTAGLAVRNAAAELTANDRIQLKWPNDLLFEGRKLAGLLCERVYKVDLIGLGLNVNLDTATAPPHLQGRVTSLMEITGAPLDLTRVLITIAARLRGTLANGVGRPFSQILTEYSSHHALTGRTVTVATDDGERPLHGVVEGLDQIGRLLIRSRGKLHRVISGQVREAEYCHR